jgi:hypothetical protein
MGELLFVDCVDEGGKKGPPVNVKWDENGATPPIRFLITRSAHSTHAVGVLSSVREHTNSYHSIVN